MRIQVLGCSGGIEPQNRTTSFLLDDDTLMDAGSGVCDLPLATLQGIHHVFLTHSHFDHLVGLPLLAEGVSRYRAARNLPPIQVYAPAATLECLQRNIFNGHIWPDFTCLPDAARPTLAFVALEEGQAIALPNGRTVEALPAAHNVPAVGYAVCQHADVWAFTGDTGSTPALWHALNQLVARGLRLRWLVAEATFANHHQAFADLTAHYTPQSLAQDIQTHLQQGNFELHLTHLKPADKADIAHDLDSLHNVAQRLRCPVHVLQRGHVFNTDSAARN